MARGIRVEVKGALFVAKDAFTTLLDGVPITVMKGTIAREGHKLLMGREHLFAPLKVDFDLGEPDPTPAPEPDPAPVADEPAPVALPQKKEDTPPAAA